MEQLVKFLVVLIQQLTNYDPTATIDDGSCVYPCLENDVTITINTSSYGSEISWDLTNSSGSVVNFRFWIRFIQYLFCIGAVYLMTVIHSTCMTHGVMDGTEVHILFLMKLEQLVQVDYYLEAAGSDDWGIGALCYNRLYRFNSY